MFERCSTPKCGCQPYGWGAGSGGLEILRLGETRAGMLGSWGNSGHQENSNPECDRASPRAFEAKARDVRARDARARKLLGSGGVLATATGSWQFGIMS